jgi:hypothetical protein
MPNIRELQLGDIKFLAKNMRASDIHEIKAASGLEPKQCLELAVIESQELYIIYKKKPLGIFGVTNKGVVWMLATEKIKKHPEFLKTFHKKYIDKWLKRYGYLYNYVHNENTVSKKWLERCGFKLKEPEKFGLKQDLFCFFSIGGKYV